MKSFKSNLVVLMIVLLAAVIAGIFVVPKWYGAKYLPWNLGLDLVGGTSLTYKIDLSEVKPNEYEAVVGGLKEVIEKRINLTAWRNLKLPLLKREILTSL